MTNDPKHPSNGPRGPIADGETAHTTVDLGDDLIAAKTRALRAPDGERAPLPRGRREGEESEGMDSAGDDRARGSSLEDPAAIDGPRAPIVVRPEQADEFFQSAGILFSEGMLEDCKRTLRAVLVADPRHAPARKLLQELHELELKQIFASDADTPAFPSRRGRGRPAAVSAEPESTEDLIRKLDLELGLHLDDVQGPESGPAPDTALFGEFTITAGASLSARDRADLGIAFMEMGLYDRATRQFELACQRVMLSSSPAPADDAQLIELTGLLARAQIADGRAFEATLNLEPLLRDTDVAHASKLELLYQMGRAFEELDQPAHATGWYRQAEGLDPNYRDLRDRLRRKTRS